MDARISNLSEYLQVIKENLLQKNYSRGENDNFLTINSKAYRNFNVKYENLISEYRKTVYKDLTSLQQEHFLAFCQHYGVPTNLVDFTMSPLVSLFFACYSDQKKNATNGYIYFIPNAIDLTEFNSKNKYFELKDLFFFVEASRNLHWELNNKISNLLLSLLQNNISRIAESNFTTKHIEDIRIGNNESLLMLANYFQNKDWYVSDDKIRHYALDKTMPRHIVLNWNVLQFNPNNLRYMCYIMLLYCLSSPSFELATLYAYNPPEIISRMTVQHSIFVYQFYNKNGNAVQQIKPVYTIEVANNKKNDILFDLDCLGINTKTVFGDYDHIAKYLLEKYNY